MEVVFSSFSVASALAFESSKASSAFSSIFPRSLASSKEIAISEPESAWGVTSPAFMARTISCNAESCSSSTKDCSSSTSLPASDKSVSVSGLAKGFGRISTGLKFLLKS